MYQVAIDQFSGPLEKLLELIEEKQLDITTVNLAAVTNDFIGYLKTLGSQDKHPGVVADFVVVASRLLLIKSKALLPSLELTEEEEHDIKDLETRLKIYQEFKQAAHGVKTLWDQRRNMLARPFLMNQPALFYPPADLSTGQLEEALRTILTELQKTVPEQQNIKRAVATIEEKVKELLGRLQENPEHSFGTLSKERPKIEVIMLFLAMLHLLRDRVITTEQGDQFSDILINKKREDSNDGQSA